MPYVAPATVVTATTITTAWGNSVKAATDYLANPPACRVRHSTTQSLTDNVDTVIAFNAERFKTIAGMHSTVTNNSRITITDAGVYVFSFTGEMAGGVTYTGLYSYVRLNGTTPIGLSCVSTGAGGNFTGTQTIYKCAAADYFEIVMRQTSGAARNLNVSNNYSPEFSAVWVGLG